MRINLEDGRYVNVTIRKNNKGIYEYSINDILVGVYDSNVMKDSKFLEVELERNNTIANELSAEMKDGIRQIVSQVKEQMEQVETGKIEDEAKENDAIDGYLEELGLDRKQVKITLRDLEEKKKEREEETRKEKTENKFNTNGVTDKQQFTTKDVDIKQEIGLDERATDVESFRKWLGGKLPKDAQKVGVIDSNEMSKMKDENGNTIDKSSTQLGLIVITKDKKVEPLKKYIPELEQNHSAGNNPMKSQYQIHTDGTLEKDAVVSEYGIGPKIMQLDKDPGDDFEVNIGKYSPHRNEVVTTRMRDRNTQFATSTEMRKAAMGHREGVYKNRNSYQEIQEHEKAGCAPEELTCKEADGEKDTGHQHFTQEEFEKCVQELMKNDEISEVFTEKEVRERLEKNIMKKPNGNGEFSDGEFNKEMAKVKVDDIEEIKEQTEAELEEDAGNFKVRGR